jgi:hypothetical protein
MKLFALLLARIPAFAAPSHPFETGSLASRQDQDICDGVNVQCCEAFALSSDLDAAHLLNLLAVEVKGSDVNVGINSNPIPITESSWYSYLFPL